MEQKQLLEEIIEDLQVVLKMCGIYRVEPGRGDFDRLLTKYQHKLEELENK